MAAISKAKSERMVTVISAFTLRPPTIEMVNEYYLSDSLELQDFIGDNLKPEFEWATSIGIIEAAKHIVIEAFANGNLK